MNDLTTFKEAVAAAVVGCNPTVLDRVVAHYAEQEAARRIPILMAGLTKEDELARGLNKFRPEQTFNEDGSVANTFWTKGTLDARKKATEQLEKLRSALADAIVKGEYDALTKVLKEGGKPADKPE